MFRAFPSTKGMLLIGLILAGCAALLAAFGNPGNMAICAACFIRDIAGGLGLHQTPVVQYMRPEIFGIILGAFFISLIVKEFQAETYSLATLLIRFLLGIVMMVGSLVFLGCPLRMIFRLSAGDGNAVFGLVGFLAGIGTAVLFLRKGFSLGNVKKTAAPVGFSFPTVVLAVFLLVLFVPQIFPASSSGPGSLHAPIWLSLLGGLAFGVLCQRGAICTSGCFRDLFLTKDAARVWPLLTLFAGMLIYHLLTGNFHPGTGNLNQLQPIAHSQQVWNFLGLYAVGFAAALASGCPLRQMILVGQGNLGGVSSFLGLLVGAGLVHRLGLAAAASSIKDGVFVAGGLGMPGRIALLICIAFLFVLGSANVLMMRKKEQTALEKAA